MPALPFASSAMRVGEASGNRRRSQFFCHCHVLASHADQSPPMLDMPYIDKPAHVAVASVIVLARLQ